MTLRFSNMCLQTYNKKYTIATAEFTHSDHKVKLLSVWEKKTFLLTVFRLFL